MTKQIAFRPVAGEINIAVDEAYKIKYGNRPYLADMIGNRAKAATVKIFPI